MILLLRALLLSIGVLASGLGWVMIREGRREMRPIDFLLGLFLLVIGAFFFVLTFVPISEEAI